MCVACVEYQAGRMTAREAFSALNELRASAHDGDMADHYERAADGIIADEVGKRVRSDDPVDPKEEG